MLLTFLVFRIKHFLKKTPFLIYVFYNSFSD